MIFIGMDDTDSRQGMCTTYLAAVLHERLARFGSVGYPRLVRLNPNIKYKTRGNAALCLVLNNGPVEEVERIVLGALNEYARFEDENTNPGVIIYEGEVPDEVGRYALRVVTEEVEIGEAVKLAEKYGMRVHRFKNGRGVVGALASIGLELHDHTFELLAYRRPENYDKPRYLDSGTVYAMDAATYPDTWDNVDMHNNVIVFSPHTPDPVLYGIRGRDPDVLKKAQQMLETEPIERSLIFITNQGTDMHLQDAKIAETRNDRSYRLRGFVSKEHYTIEGGHVFFEIEQAGSMLKCAAFEPTKNFRELVKKLIVGDEVMVYGSVKNDTVNLEKIEVISLAEQYHSGTPVCPQCSRHMESVGKDKGYRCRKCGTKEKSPVYERVERDLETGLYEVPPSARRHLAKQIIRIEKPWCTMHPSR
jgi:tRNA(Ile2)-agmatinylcytidine synthase